MTPPSSTTPATLYPSTLNLNATPARGVATESVTLLVTLRFGAPGMPLVGKTISVDFGDGSRKRRQLLAATVTTDANGQATFTHAYLTAQTYNVTAHFAGEPVSATMLARFVTCACDPVWVVCQRCSPSCHNFLRFFLASESCFGVTWQCPCMSVMCSLISCHACQSSTQVENLICGCSLQVMQLH